MSYSPFAVLGTSAQIKKNRDRMKTTPREEENEKEIDYTELLRKTYFPHLAKKDVDNESEQCYNNYRKRGKNNG